MYSLKEAWLKMNGTLPVKDWDGKIYCATTDAAITYRTNKTQGYMAAYTFTLVLQGWLKLRYNEQELTLSQDDIYLYSPGLPVTVIEVSDDYRGICLLVDEQMTIETPAVHDLVHIAYQPIVQLRTPKVSLPQEVAQMLAENMQSIIQYLHADHEYKNEILRMLYAIFLLNLQNTQDKIISQSHIPHRMEEIFTGFIHMLPGSFIKHHDIGYYASALNITPTYLSRVVRMVTGRTVMAYINQMLLMEASFMLKTTSLSITQIADRLNFANVASFSKFFFRMKGMSPKAYKRT